jgi:hypothetical protein
MAPAFRRFITLDGHRRSRLYRGLILAPHHLGSNTHLNNNLCAKRTPYPARSAGLGSRHKTGRIAR